ncbi:MAG TPA: tetratricopeptide repeat protein [Candidatus Didemnitutus sp.]|nr:tetratricopeptide repeat protein [Candidatus Didemnitutus sp.]
MNTTTMKRFLFVCVLSGFSQLAAQTATPAPAAQPNTDSNSFTVAIEARKAIVESVIQGKAVAAAALVSLQLTSNPSGLPVDSDSDLGFAASDVGFRLLGAHKPVEAMVFFVAAEASLTKALNGTAGQDAHQAVQLLRQLAFLRSQFLGKLAQARADIDAAIKLAPDNADLAKIRADLQQLSQPQLNPNANKG